MINIESVLDDGESVMVYDVHPHSQSEAITIPPGADRLIIWIGTKELGMVTSQ